MPEPSPAVVARGLVKRYGEIDAVAGVDVTVRRGEAFGFLGPNGAGKSSTMRMIGATSPRDAGDLCVLGLDPDRDGPRLRARLGVVPQEDTLDSELTVADNLLVYGRFFGLPRRTLRPRIAELLDFVQLGDRRGDKVDGLSGGMKRRLVIARALVNDPEMVLLDEPTTGLDPQARHLVWERLDRLRARGVTLVLTTHYMDEAEQLCDRLVVMDGGRVVAEGTPRDLVAAHAGRDVVEVRRRHDGDGDAALIARIAHVANRVESLPDRLLLYGDDADAMTAQVAALEPGAGELRARRATLEDVFLRLTGRTLVD